MCRPRMTTEIYGAAVGCRLHLFGVPHAVPTLGLGLDSLE